MHCVINFSFMAPPSLYPPPHRDPLDFSFGQQVDSENQFLEAKVKDEDGMPTQCVLGVSQWPPASPRGLLILSESTLGKFKLCLLLNVYDNCLLCSSFFEVGSR